MEAAGFNDLPLEILFKIFSSLDVHTVRCVLPRVCKTFRDAILHPALWHSFCVSVSVYSLRCPMWEFLLQFLRSTPVHSLQLCSQLLVDEDNYFLDDHFSCSAKTEWVAYKLKKILTRQFVKYSPYLEELSIIGFDNADLSNIATSKIKKLEIVGISSDTLYDVLCIFPHLAELKIDAFDGLWTEKLLDKMQEIKSLYLPIDNIEIPSFTLLKNIKLRRFSATDSKPTLQKLLAIRDLPLYRLELKEKFMSPVLPCSALSAFLSSCQFLNLRYLSIWYCRLDDQGAYLLRRNCPQLLNLEVENAPSCDKYEQLTESGLLHVLHLKALRKFKISVMKCETNEWFYKRWRWIPHDCSDLLPCPAGRDQLLKGWQEIELDVST